MIYMNATPTHVFVFIINKSAYCDAIERTIHRCIRKYKRVQKFRPFVHLVFAMSRNMKKLLES